MELLIWVGGFIVATVLAFVVGRFSVKSKTQIQVDQLAADVNELKEATPITMQCLLALLVAAKDGKINGECDDALKLLNKYFCKKVI